MSGKRGRGKGRWLLSAVAVAAGVAASTTLAISSPLPVKAHKTGVVEIREVDLTQTNSQLFERLLHRALNTDQADPVSFDPTDHYLAAYDDNQLAGMLEIKESTEDWYVVFVGVDPAFQGQGIGKELMSTAIALGGPVSFSLITWEDNKSARRLYESLGFKYVMLAETLNHSEWTKYMFRPPSEPQATHLSVSHKAIVVHMGQRPVIELLARLEVGPVTQGHIAIRGPGIPKGGENEEIELPQGVSHFSFTLDHPGNYKVNISAPFLTPKIETKGNRGETVRVKVTVRP